MGIYYDENEVKSNGQKVWGGGKQPHVPSGKKLVAVMDRLIYKACPDVTDPNEFQHFYDQYAEGQFVSMDLYLVPDDL